MANLDTVGYAQRQIIEHSQSRDSLDQKTLDEMEIEVIRALLPLNEDENDDDDPQLDGIHEFQIIWALAR